MFGSFSYYCIRQNWVRTCKTLHKKTDDKVGPSQFQEDTLGVSELTKKRIGDEFNVRGPR